MNKTNETTNYSPKQQQQQQQRHQKHSINTNPLTSTVLIDPKSHKNYLNKQNQLKHSFDNSSNSLNNHFHPESSYNQPIDQSIQSDLLDSSHQLESSWSITDRLRLWRDDARAQHLYQSAAFWGSKVYNLTSNPNDAFWLAQVFFLTGQFFRAEKVLTSAKRIPINSNQLESQIFDQTNELETDQLSFNSDHHQNQPSNQLNQHFSFWNDLLPDPSSNQSEKQNQKNSSELNQKHQNHQNHHDEDDDNEKTDSSTILVRMTDYSTACRYLAAQCMIRQGKWDAALELVGHVNPFQFNPTTSTTNRSDRSPSPPPIPGSSSMNNPTKTSSSTRNLHQEEKISTSNPKLKKKNYLQHQAGKAAMDGGIKFESSMSYLRGLIHLHHKSLDQAKESFLESLALDVKCYESFEALVGGNMLEPEEEWEFIQTLEYNSQTPEDAIFIKSLYTIRLKKFNHKEEIFNSLNILKNEFDLSDDPDIAFGLADWLFTNYRFIDCYRITSRILKLHYHHLPTLPLHLTCMAMIKRLLPSLFLLAHQLIERDPNSPISWYAAGLWYFSQKRWEESRRFFSKSALLDSRFPETWFAFGHALAYEGEHDQAITAYSTASHNFQGSHLPLLFIGMQHIQLANPLLAADYLLSAHKICPFDPLVSHERGVVCYYQERWEEAINFFNKTIQLIDKSQTDPIIWAPVHLNLSHCFRRLKRYKESLKAAEKAEELLPRSSTVLTAIGMAHHGLGNNLQAIHSYHQSLAILPADPMTTSLLHFSLDIETRSSSNSNHIDTSQSHPPPSLHLDDDLQPPGLLKHLISNNVQKDWKNQLDLFNDTF